MIGCHSVKGGKRYRYYTCVRAQKNGFRTCPAPSVPAEEIERFVLTQIRCADQEWLAEATQQDRSEKITPAPDGDAGLLDALVGPAWEALTAAEQNRAVQMLIAGIDYHGGDGQVTIRFHPHQLTRLAEALHQANAEVAQ